MAYNTSEPLIPSRPSTPGLISAPSPPSQPRSPRSGLRTYLGMCKRSTLLDEPTPEAPGPTSGADDPDHDQSSPEQGLGLVSAQAEIIVSPPTPSSSVFLHSAPGLSEVRFGDVSMPGKPAARFVKSHTKRHSLSAACPRKSSFVGHPIVFSGVLMTRPAGKRRSCKRSSNPPTPKSASPATTPVAESKWHIATRASHRKKRKSLRIDPPRSAVSPVLIENGGVVGGEMIHEEPIGINRPPESRLPLTPARQAPVRTRPYEAPYFFPTPGSPESIGYVERVREERRSVLVHPDGMFVRNKKDLKRPSTIFNPEKGGTVSVRGEGSHDQVPEDSGKKRSKCTLKGSGDRNPNPSPPALIDEFGVQVGTPTKLRKSSNPPQSSPSPDTTPTSATTSRPQAQRQGSRGIMRILGKH